MVVVFLAALPLLFGAAYYVYRQVDVVRERAKIEALQYMSLAAQYARSEILGAGEALAAISLTPLVRERNWQLCDAYLQRLISERYNRYSNIGVIDLQGNLLCSGVKPEGASNSNLADRNYFKLALSRSGLVVGEYQTGRLTKLPSIAIAKALQDKDGKLYGVLFASLRLTSLARDDAVPMDRDSHIAILDRNGALLVASDTSIGKVGEKLNIDGLRSASEFPSAGIFLNKVGDEHNSLGLMAAGPKNDPDAIIVYYASSGIGVFSDLRHELWIGIFFALAFVVLAVTAGWTGTNLLIGKNIRRIVAAAVRLRDRDFKTPIANEVSGSEFKLIAVQFDEMAREIDAREQDWKQSINRQTYQVELLRKVAQNAPIEDLLWDICKFAEEQLPGAVASIILCAEGRVSSVVSCSLPESFTKKLMGLEVYSGAGSCGTAITEGRMVVSDDIANDPDWVDFVELARTHKLAACRSYPIFSKGSRALGSLALYFSDTKRTIDDEISVSRIAAEIAAVAIERSITADALAQSEFEYRALFETNPYPMWVLEDCTGRFLAVNDSAIRHYGYSRDMFLNMTVRELRVLGTPSNINTPSYDQCGGRSNSVGVALHRNKKGETLQVELAYFPLLFQNRNATLNLISDVTYRSSLNNTIQEQKKLFSLLMDSTVEAIYGVDSAGRCTFANKAFEKLLGYSAKEIDGLVIHDLIHSSRALGNAHSKDTCKIQDSLKNGVYAHVDDEDFWRSDGTAIGVEYWVYPILQGGIPGGGIITFIDVSDRRMRQNELIKRATFDDLTGLLNRGSFVAALSVSISGSDSDARRPVVAVMDLDGFKEINDSLGHATGDKVLREFGQRLSASFGNSSVFPDVDIGRLGGDEFAIVFRDTSAVSIHSMTQIVVDALKKPFSISGIDLELGCSIGMACYPGAGGDVETLLRSADSAMYQAKRERNGVVFTDQINRGSSRRFLLSELRRALHEKELMLHFQPIVPLHEKSFVGFEALIRWQHPKLGVVGPDEFMPMIEISDLIHPLTDWVISSAVSSFKSILHAYPDAFVSVNVSMRNLLDQKFILRLQEILSFHNFPSRNLKLEVTESAVMTDPTRTLGVLREIHNLGIRIAVDDFGTGYSSLSYLQQLPVDDLKVDRSFVIGLVESQASKIIVLAIISLAHNLGLKVIAEGIESSDITQILKNADCDYAQGYFFSRPIPFDEVSDWISDYIKSRPSILQI
ncbi:EAL domain-containing protein [Herbaspirillum sp. C7C8]|nr:EAL domain-containing protein [Herbaspirillum sp. C7C8]